MKTNNIKLTIAAFTAACFFSTMPTMQSIANHHTNPIVVATPAPASIEVKLLGQQDEYVILEINLKQGADQNSRLIINDSKGDNLYEENVSGKTYSRKVKVSPSEVEKLEIVFNTPNGETKKMYSINVALISQVDVTEVAKF